MDICKKVNQTQDAADRPMLKKNISVRLRKGDCYCGWKMDKSILIITNDYPS